MKCDIYFLGEMTFCLPCQLTFWTEKRFLWLSGRLSNDQHSQFPLLPICTFNKVVLRNQCEHYLKIADYICITNAGFFYQQNSPTNNYERFTLHFFDIYKYNVLFFICRFHVILHIRKTTERGLFLLRS